ncbi:serine/threonine-protein kinase [Streptococcus sp. 343_SSPC]|uniref:serine/threonine-protein kinase n=1 Tax=Streptococcus sp. 343_SSPC TaxID=1579342 RepID=UPI0009E45C2E|nr:serine/threonine-protein kinase [Streptococcus sp. 343_SSPC]
MNMLREKNKVFKRLDNIPEVKTRQLIGKGGFCEVYQISNDIVEKVLMGSGEENIERFKREISYIERVNHPNIINIIDKRIDNGNRRYSYTMKRYSYNYEQYLSLVNDSDGFPLEVLENIFDAIVYLHEEGIIHRDLKPSNILINVDPFEVVVADFGLGKSMKEKSNLTQIGLGMGSANYSAPELLMGKGGIDFRVDIYSLGKILDFTIQKLQIDCPQEIKQVVEKSTEYRPGMRYSSVIELKNIFFQVEMIHSHKATIDIVISYLTEHIDVSPELFDNLFNNIIRPTIQKAEDREFEIEFKKILSSPQIVNHFLTNFSKEFEDYLIYYCDLVQGLPRFDEEANFIVSCLYQLIEEPGADEVLLSTVWKTLIQLAFISYTNHGSYDISSLIKIELSKILNSRASFKKQLLDELSTKDDLNNFYEDKLKMSEK